MFSRKRIHVTTAIMLFMDVLMIFDEFQKTQICKSRSREDDFSSKFCCGGVTENAFHGQLCVQTMT